MVDTACKSETIQEGDSRILIIDCRECDMDFVLEECLSGIVLSLEGEYNVDKVILSDYIERQYSRDSLLLLKGLKELSEELNRFSSRKTDGKDCDGCPLKPAKMYPELKETLTSSPRDVFPLHHELLKEVMSMEGCTSCRKSAKEELTVLGEKILDLRSDILLKAFGVLG